MEKALFDWPIVLQYDVKAKYRLISRKFFGHEVFSAELNQSKATHVCIRSINKSNRFISVRFLFLFVRAFSLQDQTKIALYEVSFFPVEGSLAYLIMSNLFISYSKRVDQSMHERWLLAWAIEQRDNVFSHINARLSWLGWKGDRLYRA